VGKQAGLLAADVLAGTDPRTIPIRDVLDVIPKQLTLNLRALKGLRDPWTVPEAVRRQAPILVHHPAIPNHPHPRPNPPSPPHAPAPRPAHPAAGPRRPAGHCPAVAPALAHRRPRRARLIVNKTAARECGVALPATLVGRAGEVLE